MTPGGFASHGRERRLRFLVNVIDCASLGEKKSEVIVRREASFCDRRLSINTASRQRYTVSTEHQPQHSDTDQVRHSGTETVTVGHKVMVQQEPDATPQSHADEVRQEVDDDFQCPVDELRSLRSAETVCRHLYQTDEQLQTIGDDEADDG